MDSRPTDRGNDSLIVEFIHRLYIETHLGGGAVMRNKRSAKRNIGIELNPKTIQVWKNYMIIAILGIHFESESV